MSWIINEPKMQRTPRRLTSPMTSVSLMRHISTNVFMLGGSEALRVKGGIIGYGLEQGYWSPSPPPINFLTISGNFEQLWFVHIF